MEKKEFKYISVAYKLYTTENGERILEEEAPKESPFCFISGFGTTIPGFEANIAKLSPNDTFDFVLTKNEAYGDYYDERVIDLDKNIFTINGKFDTEHIFVDAIIPLQNEDGNRFMGQVLSISDDKVKIDLNHPLAGKELNFIGNVVESRDATVEEIQMLLKQLSGEGCGCGGNCGGTCGENCGEEGGCNCEGGCGGCK